MKSFSKILFVADPSLDDAASLRRAKKLIELSESLTVFAALNPRMPGKSRMDLLGINQRQVLETILAKEKERLRASVLPDLDTQLAFKVVFGTPFLEVVREVVRGGYDLVIKTAGHVRGLSSIFGSTDMHLLRKCPCPIWLIKPNPLPANPRIVAAVDFSDSEADEALDLNLNEHILDCASTLTAVDGGQLDIVHVWDAPGEVFLRSVRLSLPVETVDGYVKEERRQHKKFLDNLIETQSSKLPPPVASDLKTHVLKGHPRAEIPKKTKSLRADTLVMGTLGRTGIAGLFMGNTAESILNRPSCSVFAIKPDGFQTPITLPNEHN